MADPTIQFSAHEIQKGLSGIARFIQFDNPNELRKPLLDWNEYMEVRTDVLFATGERDGVRWQRLKPSTKASRRLMGVGHSRPLEVTGGLRRSIRTKVVQGLRGLTAVLESKSPLARIHHGGASVGAHEVRPTKAKVLRFSVGGSIVFAAKVNIPAFEIPARPILFISERDELTAIRYVRTYTLKAMKKMVGPSAKVVNA